MDDKARKFFYDLVTTPGPSGFEEPVQRVVRDYAGEFADELRTDLHGNLIAVRKYADNSVNPFRVMLAGHCDQIGFIINYIDGEGFLYMLPIGGWDPPVVIGARVTIWGKDGPVKGVIGKKPIHLLNEDERKKVAKIQDLWIDIGSKSAEESQAVVAVGDVVTVELVCNELMNNRIAAVGTDDKAGVWVVMEALRRIDPTKCQVDVYAVSTVQEEVGLRGSRTSAFGIDPQVGIAVDVTFATDAPTIDKKLNGDVSLGGGPVVGIGPNMNRKLTNELIAKGREYEIPVQLAAEGKITGTDAGSIQVNRAGVATALVSIPNRYMHTPVEVISWDDLDNAANLLARYCESVKPDQSYIPS